MPFLLRLPSLLLQIVLACLGAIAIDRVLQLLWLVVDGSLPHSFVDMAGLRLLEVGILAILWPRCSVSTLDSTKQIPRELAWGLGISGLGFASVLGLDLALKTWLKLELLPLFLSPVLDEPLWSVVAFGVVAGPLAEELFFRAFLWKIIAQSPCAAPGKAAAVALSVFCFATLHLKLEHSLMSQWPMLLAWSCCGAMGFAFYLWRRSIVVPFIVHGCANAAMLLPWGPGSA